MRAYAAKRLTGTKFTTAVGSIAVERVFDGITLVAFLAIASWAGGFGTQTAVGNVTLGAIGKLFAAVFSLALLVAVVFVRWPDPALRIMRSVSGSILPDTWANRLVEAIEGLLEGLDVLRSPRRFFAVLLWSLIVWTTGAASFWLGFLAFGIEVPWSAALLLQSLLGFGVAVQFSPGFFGQFEAICRATLALYAVGTGPAVSFAFGFHLGGFVPITLLGLWSLSRAHLHLADLNMRDENAGD